MEKIDTSWTSGVSQSPAGPRCSSASVGLTTGSLHQQSVNALLTPAWMEMETSRPSRTRTGNRQDQDWEPPGPGLGTAVPTGRPKLRGSAEDHQERSSTDSCSFQLQNRSRIPLRWNQDQVLFRTSSTFKPLSLKVKVQDRLTEELTFKCLNQREMTSN